MTTTEGSPATPEDRQSPRISEATAAAWRRNIRLTMAPPAELNGHPVNGQPASGHPLNGHTLNGQPASGHTVNGQPASGHPLSGHTLNGHRVTESGARHGQFAASQQTGLSAMISLARPAEDSSAATAGSDEPEPAAASWRARVPRPLLVILTVQAVLSAQLMHANTAFEDEALYLWAGRLEWAHLLHGTATPPFPTYFSGAPVIYPPLAALAAGVGGLTGARILSLCFMLGATALLWKVTDRLCGRRAAYFAAGLWAVLGPTQRLGAFATYDAMALFLLALAACCVTAGRGQRDATRWMLAGAAALVLANATKYASALFDPTIAALALLTGYPPGGKVASRRVAYFLAVMVASVILLLQAGGGWYIAGIDQTTLTRSYGGTPAGLVLHSSWDWTAVVIVLALAAVLISVRTEKRAHARWLLATLAATAFLVPIEQARIHTYTSLSKHVDFGCWFAAIAAGYAIDRMIGWLRGRSLQAVATAACAAALAPVAFIGVAQADSFFAWPGTAKLVPQVRQLASPGGRFLADDTPPLEYYLPEISWRQWSSVYGITLSSGRREAENGNDFAPYRTLLAEHYFKLVILAFTDKTVLDVRIAGYLQTDSSYRFVGTVPFSNPGAHGSYLIWAYQGAG